MVIDMLNMGQHMRHQLAVWGKYSDRIHDYTDRGLQHVLETEGGKRLRTIVDPYSYLSKIDQPKLIILGTNDSYWPLDAANLYWNDVTGDKYLLYVPNNGHGLRDMPRVLGSLAALHESQANGTKLPKLDWKFSGGEGDHKDGAGDLNAGDGRLTNGGRPLKLVIESDVKPQRVSAWTATSATRDFRQAHWTSAEMREKDGRYEYELATPTEGHVAIFGEAVYNGRPAPYFFSTNVRVVGAKEEAGE